MIIKSHFLKPDSLRKMSFYGNHFLVYDQKGIIQYFGNNFDEIPDKTSHKFIDYTDRIILPGLTDLHTHIPQYPATGLGKGTLLSWLEEYIFPLEEKFNHPEYAYNLSKIFFEECIKFGTTTVTAYSNSSFNGTDAAFEAAKDTTIRAFIGMSLIDINAPENLLKTTESNINETLQLAEKWHGSSDGMLNYVITPRYALICTFELMKKAAEIAKSENLFIQTHLAENTDELIAVYNMYPEFPTYTDVYYQAGLLGERTLLGHCIYLSMSEIDVIRDTGSNIVHCASSNRFLKSGIFPYSNLKNVIPIGIGTDVAGGTSLSMLHELKETVETSKSYQYLKDRNSSVLSPQEALWIAAKGNAEILKISDKTGNFEKGMFADFLTIKSGRLRLTESEMTAENISAKLLYLIGNQYVNSTFIRGECVYGE